MKTETGGGDLVAFFFNLKLFSSSINTIVQKKVSQYLQLQCYNFKSIKVKQKTNKRQTKQKKGSNYSKAVL